MDIHRFVALLRSQWEWLAVAATAGGFVALLAAVLTTPKFAATAELFLATPGYSSVSSMETGDNSPFQADAFSQQRARSYVELATRPDLARRVVDNLQLDMHPTELTDSMSARVQPDTVLIEITAKSPSPVDAQNIANAAAAELAADIRLLETPAGMRVPNVDPVAVQSAKLPGRPAEPKLIEYALLGISFGFLIGISAVALGRGRRVLGDVRATEEAAALPVLGVVCGGEFPDSSLVALRMLREMSIRPAVCLVVAAGQHDTRSPSRVSAELASGLARSGAAVVLVEFDRAGVDGGDRLNSAEGAGLVGVLADAVPVESALQPTDVSDVMRLSGPAPENVLPLFRSEAFCRTMTELRELADVVLFDGQTIPGLASSVAAPSGLIGAVDHVVVVVETGVTRRNELEATVDRLHRQRFSILGVVMCGMDRTATGATSKPSSAPHTRRTVR